MFLFSRVRIFPKGLAYKILIMQSSPHDAQDTHLCVARPEDLVQISHACFAVIK